VLLAVALEVDLGTLWKEALTALLATTAEAVTASFSAHAGAESVLTFAGALRWLKGAFHDRKTLVMVLCPRLAGVAIASSCLVDGRAT